MLWVLFRQGILCEAADPKATCAGDMAGRVEER